MKWTGVVSLNPTKPPISRYAFSAPRGCAGGKSLPCRRRLNSLQTVTQLVNNDSGIFCFIHRIAELFGFHSRLREAESLRSQDIEKPNQESIVV